MSTVNLENYTGGGGGGVHDLWQLHVIFLLHFLTQYLKVQSHESWQKNLDLGRLYVSLFFQFLTPRLVDKVSRRKNSDLWHLDLGLILQFWRHDKSTRSHGRRTRTPVPSIRKSSIPILTSWRKNFDLWRLNVYRRIRWYLTFIRTEINQASSLLQDAYC